MSVYPTSLFILLSHIFWHYTSLLWSQVFDIIPVCVTFNMMKMNSYKLSSLFLKIQYIYIYSAWNEGQS